MGQRGRVGFDGLMVQIWQTPVRCGRTACFVSIYLPLDTISQNFASCPNSCSSYHCIGCVTVWTDISFAIRHQVSCLTPSGTSAAQAGKIQGSMGSFEPLFSSSRFHCLSKTYPKKPENGVFDVPDFNIFSGRV